MYLAMVGTTIAFRLDKSRAYVVKLVLVVAAGNLRDTVSENFVQCVASSVQKKVK